MNTLINEIQALVEKWREAKQKIYCDDGFASGVASCYQCRIDELSAILSRSAAGEVSGVSDAPLSVFSEGTWTYSETGQSFGKAAMDEAAFVVYRAALESLPGVRVDADRLAMALEAVEIAEGVMSYCQGDAWERECTESDRDRFDELHQKLFPTPVKAISIYTPSEQTNYIKPRVKCPVCGGGFRGDIGVREHMRVKHPESLAAAPSPKETGE